MGGHCSGSLGVSRELVDLVQKGYHDSTRAPSWHCNEPIHGAWPVRQAPQIEARRLPFMVSLDIFTFILKDCQMREGFWTAHPHIACKLFSVISLENGL